MRGGHRGNFQRGHRRAGIFGGGAGGVAEKEKPAAAANPEMPVVRAAVGRSQRGRGFIFAATARFENDGGGRFENRDQAAADGGGAEGNAVWLARSETPEIKRDSLLRRGPHARHGRGPDEPRGFEPHRGLEGGRGETAAQRQRGL